LILFFFRKAHAYEDVNEGNIGLKVVGGVAMVIILVSQGKILLAATHHS
jgi:hypothetical protein